MTSQLFPSQKPRFDAVLFVLGGIALTACFFLREIGIFQTMPAGYNERLHVVIDSVLGSKGLPRDSVEILLQSSVDEALLDAVKNVYGGKTKEYLDTANVQENLVRVRIDKRTGGTFSVNAGSANRPRSSTKKQQIVESNFIQTLWLDKNLRVVGEARRLKDTLSKLIQPSSNTAQESKVLDTGAIRQRVLLGAAPKYLPQNRENLDWKSDTSDSQSLAFVAVLGKDSLLRREWSIKLTEISSAPEEWLVEWQSRVVLAHPPAEVVGSDTPIQPKTVATIAYWVITIVTCGILWILFLNRLKMKAVWIWLISLAPFAGLAMTLVTFGSVSLPWFVYGIMVIFYTIGIGLFMLAIPLAALISVLREIVAEKFYALLQTVPAPLRSFHWGRMILVGVSFGGLYNAFTHVLMLLGIRLNIGWLANVHIYPEAYIVAFALREPWTALFQMLFFIVPVTLMVTLTAFATAERFVPQRWKMRVTLILSLLFWSIFSATQVMSLSYILLQGAAYASITVFILRRFDILAFLAFVVTSTMAFSFGLYDIVWWGQVIPVGFFAFLITPALAAYLRNSPEAVSESDYKPDFVLLIEENERLHQEIAAAKSVQQKLLPRSLPTLERVRISAACIPAYEVGGDYYDFFPLDDKRLGVLIGDVSGKGISAAFYITLAKGVIVSQVRGSGSPSEVLHRVNALLYGVMERGKFVSMIYGIYDTSTGEFAFANAGHNPLVVLQANGNIRTVAAKGMAIGLDKGERFERAVSTMNLTLEKGDCVLLYTDGVTEAMNTANEEYGEDRMMTALKAAPLSADDIVSAALSDVRKFAGKAHQHDDITLVALQAV